MRSILRIGRVFADYAGITSESAFSEARCIECNRPALRRRSGAHSGSAGSVFRSEPAVTKSGYIDQEIRLDQPQVEHRAKRPASGNNLGRAIGLWGYVKACRKTGEFAHAIAAVLVDPESATARVVIGALDAAPIVLGDAAALFGGQVTGDFRQQFDPRVADAILMKAGLTNAADRHIQVAVLRRAIDEAST